MLSFWRLFAQKRWKLLPSGYLTCRHGIDGQFIDGVPIKNVDFPWLCQITRYNQMVPHFVGSCFFQHVYRFEEVCYIKIWCKRTKREVENHHVGFYRSENDLQMLGFPHLYYRSVYEI